MVCVCVSGDVVGVAEFVAVQHREVVDCEAESHEVVEFCDSAAFGAGEFWAAGQVGRWWWWGWWCVFGSHRVVLLWEATRHDIFVFVFREGADDFEHGGHGGDS